MPDTTSAANFDDNSGYGNSAVNTFTIPDAADGSAVTPIDLERHYAFIILRCADVSNVGAATDTLGIQLGMTDADDMLELEDNLQDVTIIMDDIFHRAIFVGAARRVRPVLSAVASGGTVVIEVYGADAATVA